MANENLIQTIQTEISKAGSAARFNVQGIPQHVHNNIDAPFAYQPSLSYTGTVLEGDAIGPVSPTPLLFPNGWTVDFQDTSSPSAGAYIVTHSLNTDYYSVVVTPLENNPNNPTFVGVNIQTNPSNFLLYFFDTKTQAFVDCGFTFVLVNTVNKLSLPPKYTFNG